MATQTIGTRTAGYLMTKSSVSAIVKTTPSISDQSREVVEFVVDMLTATVEYLLENPQAALTDKKKASKQLLAYFARKGIALGKLTGDQKMKCVASVFELGMSYKEGAMTISLATGVGTMNPYAWYCAVSFLATCLGVWEACHPVVKHFLETEENRARMQYLERLYQQLYPLLKMEQDKRKGVMTA